MSGVRQTVTIEPFQPPPAFQPLGGVAVIADNTWAAMQGPAKTKESHGTTGPNRTYNSDEFKKELQDTGAKTGES